MLEVCHVVGFLFGCGMLFALNPFLYLFLLAALEITLAVVVAPGLHLSAGPLVVILLASSAIAYFARRLLPVTVTLARALPNIILILAPLAGSFLQTQHGLAARLGGLAIFVVGVVAVLRLLSYVQREWPTGERIVLEIVMSFCLLILVCSIPGVLVPLFVLVIIGVLGQRLMMRSLGLAPTKF